MTMILVVPVLVIIVQWPIHGELMVNKLVYRTCQHGRNLLWVG